jgi:hypothetical protein
MHSEFQNSNSVEDAACLLDIHLLVSLYDVFWLPGQK